MVVAGSISEQKQPSMLESALPGVIAVVVMGGCMMCFVLYFFRQAPVDKLENKEERTPESRAMEMMGRPPEKKEQHDVGLRPKPQQDRQFSRFSAMSAENSGHGEENEAGTVHVK